MDLSSLVLLDFETRSLADLPLIGGRNYAAHPTTAPICCVFYVEGDYLTWVQGDPDPPPAPIMAAHNARDFDRHIWETTLGWPAPELWLDTSEMARSSGLPGKLAEIARRLGRVQKDMTGNAITLALSDTKLPPSRKDKVTGEPIVQIPPEIKDALRGYHEQLKLNIHAHQAGGAPFQWPPIPAIVLEAVISYCTKDVVVMAEEVLPLVADFADLEPRVAEVWHHANDRGVCFDSALARQLLTSDQHEAARITGIPLAAINDDQFRAVMIAEGVRLPQDMGTQWLRRIRDKGTPVASELARERLRVSALRYSPSFMAMVLEAGGPRLPDSKYESVEPLLRHENPAVAALARARLSVASIAGGKCEAGLARVSADGRMRDNVRYFGAHTGRGAGGGLQLQNFPHPDGLGVDGVPVKDWDDARVIKEIAAPRLYNQAEISMLLRACLHASPGNTLVAADYSGVEARANAWAAGDRPALALFHQGGDAYRPLACQLFGIDPEAFSKKTHFFERDTSKKAELGCGYQMGAPKFKITAEKGGMKWRDPSECAERQGGACTSPVCGVIERDSQGNPFTHGAKTIVSAWRALHSPIVDFWYSLERAAVEAVDSRTHVRVDCAIDLSFDFVGGDLAMVLPSGRPVVYRQAQVSEGKYGPQVRFFGPKGYGHLYGGLLCENGIQSTCREFLVNGMINAEDAGLPVLFTVHDEIVTEVPRARADWGLETLSKAMTTLPAWASGMPVAVEGFTCERYRK